MIRGPWVLTQHDLLLWHRMPRAVISALVPPLGMGLLLISLTVSVSKQPVALVVESRGQSAQDMTQIIELDQEAYSLTVTDAKTALTLLQEQAVAAVIVIPPGFDAVVRAHTATVDLTLNNVDIDFADDIRRTVTRSVAEFDAPQLAIQGSWVVPARGPAQAMAYVMLNRDKRRRHCYSGTNLTGTGGDNGTGRFRGS